ncbi:hypothetical protein E8E15_001732 [Penicillium rubens]|uniref:uncharacterized protein n=1 Tax=Penicillium rubens TaxID=1108849 RepID=UPI001D44626F|nr:uncharacterized protein N7525_011075 [Penicillium rubens]KAF3014311.1 hypothetical protein E8E15_001732 [Penicillium rubens]KAJ5821791.1 hypothetical protein N7525_011075 [Penicillium rubens]KAJ5859436.1 hypothetical protein N7534_004713 [Penicillium rubens]
MQEGAQFVAFLKDKKPPAEEPVFLIFQDGSELYVSAAIPSAAYLAYIRNQCSKLDSTEILENQEIWALRYHQLPTDV